MVLFCSVLFDRFLLPLYVHLGPFYRPRFLVFLFFRMKCHMLFTCQIQIGKWPMAAQAGANIRMKYDHPRLNVCVNAD